jgi:hypothetical protein
MTMGIQFYRFISSSQSSINPNGHITTNIPNCLERGGDSKTVHGYGSFLCSLPKLFAVTEGRSACYRQVSHMLKDVKRLLACVRGTMLIAVEGCGGKGKTLYVVDAKIWYLAKKVERNSARKKSSTCTRTVLLSSREDFLGDSIFPPQHVILYLLPKALI